MSGMKLQTVCARVNELIYDFGDEPWIRELPAVDGKHPLELIEYTEGAGRGMSPAASHGAREMRTNNALRQGGDGSVLASVADPHTAAGPGITDSRADHRSKLDGPGVLPKKRLVYVTPYIPGRQSMSVEDAQRTLAHPMVHLIPDWLTDEARDVVKKGEHWRLT